jgi:hypothetical protein
MTDDGRRVPSDGKSSHCLWQGELTTVSGLICRSTQTHYSDSEPTSLCSFSFCYAVGLLQYSKSVWSKVGTLTVYIDIK